MPISAERGIRYLSSLRIGKLSVRGVENFGWSFSHERRQGRNYIKDGRFSVYGYLFHSQFGFVHRIRSSRKSTDGQTIADASCDTGGTIQWIGDWRERHGGHHGQQYETYYDGRKDASNVVRGRQNA